MWLALAFLSAFLLGCYEVNKKMSLNGNAVIPVLFFNTLISSLIFVPFILLSFYTDCLDGTMVYVPRASLEDHLKVLIKAVIVLSSWISGYFALKHLPLTITGPIKASQPVLTLLGAMLLFGERLNLFQWVGVLLSIASFNVYQCVIMSFILLFLWYPNRKKSTPFQWRWNIIFISVFLCVADWVYFYALTFPDSMISIVSMVRRSNVLVTFLAGAIFFHEKNLKNKAIDLFLVLLGMIFLYLGTK